MHKKVIVAELAGAIVPLVWTAVINVFPGFDARFKMRQLPDERAARRRQAFAFQSETAWALSPSSPGLSGVGSGKGGA